MPFSELTSEEALYQDLFGPIITDEPVFDSITLPPLGTVLPTDDDMIEQDKNIDFDTESDLSEQTLTDNDEEDDGPEYFPTEAPTAASIEARIALMKPFVDEIYDIYMDEDNEVIDGYQACLIWISCDIQVVVDSSGKNFWRFVCDGHADGMVWDRFFFEHVPRLVSRPSQYPLVYDRLTGVLRRRVHMDFYRIQRACRERVTRRGEFERARKEICVTYISFDPREEEDGAGGV